MMVYDLVYDEDGNIKNAILMHSAHGTGGDYIKTKISPKTTIGKSGEQVKFGSGNHLLYYKYLSNDIYEGGLIEGSLNLKKITEESVWVNIKNAEKAKNEYSVLRFITQDEEGNAVLNYKGKYISALEENDYDNEIINLSNNTENRLKYSKLYIEKTVDVHADDVVETNEELEYTIVVKNNSSNDYNENIHVNENLSDYVTYKNYTINKENIGFEEDLENKKIRWNIGKLKAGEEVRIKYKVVVNENCYGETIESTGTVGNIPSAIVKNKITSNLTDVQENLLVDAYDKLKDEYTDKELINKIYFEAFGKDLNFEEFEITELINNTKVDEDSSTTISLNKENQFYNSVLNKYWSTLYSKTYDYEGEEVIHYSLKLWRYLTSNARRADTIYGENFKTGDILVYRNENDVIYKYNEDEGLTRNYITYENGEYAYIYIEGKGFVGINYGADGEVGTQDDRDEFNAKYYIDNGLNVYSNEEETDEEILEFMNYQTLLGKDYYVILRPAMSVDFHTEVIDQAVAPTCIETGLTEGKHCSVCNEVFVAQETIPALGHNYENGECTRCGKDSPEITVTSEKYTILENYITKISPKTTVQSLKANLQTNAGGVKIYNKNNELVEEDENLATGMKVKVDLYGKKQEYIIVVIGDINGDGEANFRDILQINKHRLNKGSLVEECLKAGDVTEDGKVNFSDILQINKYRLGK